jgi:hypothetical protein
LEWTEDFGWKRKKRRRRREELYFEEKIQPAAFH